VSSLVYSVFREGAAGESKIGQAVNVHACSLAMLCMRILQLFSQWQGAYYSTLWRGLQVAYYLWSMISKMVDLHLAICRPILAEHIGHVGHSKKSRNCTSRLTSELQIEGSTHESSLCAVPIVCIHYI
jgi:hypothetical protein